MERPDEDTSVSNQELRLQNVLEIKNISFSYPTGGKVIKDVSLTIRKGETIALVGGSGGGKTTLIDIIAGVFPVQEGQVLLDGVPHTDIRLGDWRKLFGIVSQVPVLFHDTVEDNISFAQEVTEEEIIKASKIANAHEFITHLPEGYKTVIGDKGMKLSGGQRQRLTIARAIISDPEILILDEATSSLDSKSEKLVQEALEYITKNSTSIVIAHRLSTVINADKIIVMKEGRIIDVGTHQSLLDTSPDYENLVKMQSFS